MLILSNENVASLLNSLSAEDIINILKALATALGNHEILQPHRQSYTHPQPASSTTLIMPTFTSSSSSIKIVSLDTSQDSQNTSPKGSLLLFSSDGSLDAVLNAAEVTGFRTALASMIPVLLRFLPELVCKDYAAAGHSKPIPLDTVLIFGAGLQAEWAVKLLLILCSHDAKSPTNIVIINRSIERARKLIGKLLPWHASKILPHTKSIPTFECHQYSTAYSTGNVESLVTAADAIFCCTPSHTPLFPASCLQSPVAQMKTRYISAIGSYTPEMQEIHPDLLIDNTLKFTTIVDNIEGCKVEAGEIIMAEERILLDNEATEFRMWEVGLTWDKANQADGKCKPQIRKTLGEENIFYKSVGTGLMDLAVAEELVRIARALKSADTGLEVPGF